MSFAHTLTEFALFLSPAIAIALSDDEKRELAQFERMLERRKAELALCKSNKNFSNRVKAIKSDIAQIETAITDLRIAARYRRGV